MKRLLHFLSPFFILLIFSIAITPVSNNAFAETSSDAFTCRIEPSPANITLGTGSKLTLEVSLIRKGGNTIANTGTNLTKVSNISLQQKGTATSYNVPGTYNPNRDPSSDTDVLSMSIDVDSSQLSLPNADAQYNISADAFAYGAAGAINPNTAIKCTNSVVLHVQPNQSKSIAATPTPTPSPSGSAVENGTSGTLIDTDPSKINGYTSSIKVTFTNLPNDTYSVCFSTDPSKCFDSDKFQLTSISPDNGELSFTVCGAGTDTLKAITPDKPKNCDPTRDYFHEGYTYSVSLFSEQDLSDSPDDSMSFFVYHKFPSVIVTTADNGKKDLSTIFDSNNQSPAKKDLLSVANPVTLNIYQQQKLGGAKNNNFNFTLETSTGDLVAQKCFVAGQNEQDSKGLITLGASGINGSGYLEPGMYNITISEGVNDGSSPTTTCDSGFVYYEIPITVSQDDKGNIVTTIDLSQVQKDPAQDETSPFTTKGNIIIPCAAGSRDPNNGGCARVDTALGPINTDPLQLMGSLMTYILSFSGAIILIQLIYAGYQIMTSRGDKEKVSKAREKITSSIIGFIFIVLSLIILQIIGVNILQIPGFTR